MAKSLRSKQKRKFRALKRQKNAPRELAKLKQVLGGGGQLEPDMFERVKGKRFAKSILIQSCATLFNYASCMLSFFPVSNTKTKEDQEGGEKEEGMITIY